jgi:hypothetical protein
MLPSAGLTLMEMAVAMAVSGILIVGLARFFKDFNRSFNTREQVADRDMNAHYTVKRMSEALMAAGSNLPSKDWPVLVLPDGNPGSRVILAVNPRGGVQYVATPIVGKIEVTVDDGKGFAKADGILADPKADGRPTFRVAIDQSYQANGFSKGIKVSGDIAILRLKSALTLAAGDAIYAHAIEDYRLVNDSLMLNDMVLAENIQKLTFTLLTADQARTDQWSAMRSAKVKVTARTRSRDPGYAANGGYRTLDLSMDILLRNRL